MVGQTTVRQGSNGRGARGEESTFRRSGHAVRTMAHLLHDAVTLGQLQLRLLALDLEEAQGRLWAPGIAVGIGLLLAAGCIPIALIGFAFILTDLAHLTRVAAVWIVFAVALAIGAACIGCGIWWFRSRPPVFASSREELNLNIERLKEMLRRATHPSREGAGDESRGQDLM